MPCPTGAQALMLVPAFHPEWGHGPLGRAEEGLKVATPYHSALASASRNCHGCWAGRYVPSVAWALELAQEPLRRLQGLQPYEGPTQRPAGNGPSSAMPLAKPVPPCTWSRVPWACALRAEHHCAPAIGTFDTETVLSTIEAYGNSYGIGKTTCKTWNGNGPPS